ncbi:MAG: hypothetical protein GY950_06960 [bacterium]|nr:hypothetical protein [bacterium]
MRRFLILIILLLIAVIMPGAKLIPMPGLEKPNSITLDDRHLYITDQATIAVYSLGDFKLIRKFGKAGEGPGEFILRPYDRLGLRIFLKEDTILVNSAAKVSLFKKDGTFIDEKRVNSVIQYFKPLGSKIVGYEKTTVVNESMDFIVNIYDPATFKKEKEIHRKPYYVQAKKPFDPTFFAMAMKDGARRSTNYHPYGNKLFVGGGNDDILVFDTTGQKLYTIHCDHEKIKIPETFKKGVIAYLKKRLPTAFVNIKNRMEFPDYFPIRSFSVSDDKIYVQGFENADGYNGFYVLDIKGKFLRKIMIPFEESELLCAYPYTIGKGKFYQLNENPDTEEWELRITDLGK